MKVFLTGSTGFIGLSLTRQLISRGWEVVALARRPDTPQAKAVAAAGATVIQGDILQKETLRQPMQGADMVIHNAGSYELGVTGEAKQRMHAINVDGTHNVLGMALELNIPRTVYVSTSRIFSVEHGLIDETTPIRTKYINYYEETKILAHEVAVSYQEKGLPLMIACPNGVIGVNDHSIFGYFIRMHVNNMMVPFAWAPNSEISPVHVDDCAEGIALIAEKGTIGQMYILSGEKTSNREFMAHWADNPGGMKVRFFIPTPAAMAMFAMSAPLLRALGLPAFLSVETVIAAEEGLPTTSKKIRDELGWQHRTAADAWREIVQGELALKAQRGSNNPVALLKPVSM